MVHALKECWRVLESNGHLLDVRPLTGGLEVEVIADSKPLPTGQLDDSDGTPDDEAANLAMETVVQDGLFAKSYGTKFRFAYYWDDLAGMETFIEERWGEFVTMPAKTRENTRHRLKGLDSSSYQLRVFTTVQLVSYLKI